MIIAQRFQLLSPVGVLSALLLYPVLTSDMNEPPGAQAAQQREAGDYIAYSLLHVESRQPRLLPQAPGPESFDTREFDSYRRTQLAMIRSAVVVNAALRQPNIAELELIKRHPNDAREWLASAIKAEFLEDGDVLRISLRGENPEELKEIVDAVKTAYLNVLTHHESSKRIVRLAQLDRTADEFADRYRQKRVDIRALSEVQGIVHQSLHESKQRMSVEHITHLRRELTRVNLELIKTQVEQSAQAKAAASRGDAPVPETVVSENVDADSSIGKLRERVEALQEAIENTSRITADPRTHRLAAASRELEEAKQALETRRADIRLAVLEKLRAGAVNHAHISVSRLDSQIAILNAQRDFLQKELEAEREIERQELDAAALSANQTIELQMLREEVDQIAKIWSTVVAEQEALRVELRAPPRVTEIHPAEVSRAKQ